MLKFGTDTINNRGATGWALSTTGEPVRLSARAHGAIIGSTIANAYRGDIVNLFSEYPSAARSGYSMSFDQMRTGVDRPTRVEILADCGPGTPQTIIGEEIIINVDAFEKHLQTVPLIATGPYPPRILTAARDLFPEANDAVGALISVTDIRPLPILSDYARYLRACWSHFKFVEKFFPETNRSSNSNAKDFLCKQSSVIEMMSIAHHLYVLKSYGVTGAFAEFGCFKGYSSSMLSYACSLLNIDMHIFDSFEGLPPSASEYYQSGDFRGAIDEVRANISQFGVFEAVTFHKGFFSESLKQDAGIDWISLWMDVDLDSSARDVMPAAARVVPEGAIFSHECSASNFDNGVPVPLSPGPNNVVPPILEHFRSIGSRPRGQFIYGNTGAFWREQGGIPVLAMDLLSKLLNKIES